MVFPAGQVGLSRFPLDGSCDLDGSCELEGLCGVEGFCEGFCGLEGLCELGIHSVGFVAGEGT